MDLNIVMQMRELILLVLQEIYLLLQIILHDLN